jgi:dimethylhistidine N-methyltransferase
MAATSSAVLGSEQFAADVAAGLTKAGQKELPSKYLYDRVGSRLFDVITALPEYGLTRAEERILRTHAREMVARLPSSVIVAELGSGSGQKTRWLLEALGRRRPTAYYPIEISRTALTQCEHEMADIDSISVVGLEHEYVDGLLEVAARRKDGQAIAVLFLGSTLGNLEGAAAVAFLARLRRILEPGDTLLLGADLVKPVPRLLAAYDDPLGVTAAFNLNLLARINRELGANFVLSRFAHEARFNDRSSSIEMHIRSLRAQRVNMPLADIEVAFREGETIWTESSHKFSLGEVCAMGEQSGFRCEAQWVDEEGQFADSLLVAQ